MNDPKSNSSAIYMIHTKEFNRLVNEGKAILDYTEKEENEENYVIDPYPNIFDSFSLDIVSEIWVKGEDFMRYINLINLPDSKLNQLSEPEKKLRQNLIPLFKKNIIKAIPFVFNSVLEKKDKDQRFLSVGTYIGLWMAERRLFDKIPVFKAKDEPLPKDEPLTPLDAVLKFMSELPKDISPEDRIKYFDENENNYSMPVVFSTLMPYSFTLFQDFEIIMDLWIHTLKTPMEMEARAKEILEDDELARLFMVNMRRRKEVDSSLEQAVFLSDDAWKAIKTLIQKDYGVNILIETVNRLHILVFLVEEETKDAMLSYISALEPEKLMYSPLSRKFNFDKETDILKKKEITKALDNHLVFSIFMGEFLNIYNILINKGYSSKKAGELIADLSYHIDVVFRKIGIGDLLRDPNYEINYKNSEKIIFAEPIANELIRRQKVFFKYKVYGHIISFSISFAGVFAGVLLYTRLQARHLNILKINKFKEAISDKIPKETADLLTDRKIIKLVNLSELTIKKVTNTLKNIKLTGSQKRTIVNIIKQIQSEFDKDKKKDADVKAAPNPKIQNTKSDILESQ